MRRYITVSDNLGEYYIDLDKRIAVYVDSSNIGNDSIGHLENAWEPDENDQEIDESQFISAYNLVMSKIKL